MRILTGIKPSGDLHLGNYLGAIRPALQMDGDVMLCIANYHAMTTVQDPEYLREHTYKLAAAFMALGLDGDKHTLYRQSDVPQVHELTWILSCLIPPGMLDRGHAVKAAKNGGIDINVGTWMYPVLMASDILMFGTEGVPVGRDQLQHINIAHDIANKVNHRAGYELFKNPKPLVQEEVAVVPGTDGRKMSKSYNNTIPLFLPPKEMLKAIKKISTDSTPMSEPMNPDSCNVFNLYKHFATEEQVEDMRQAYARSDFGYGHAKQKLFLAVEEELGEARDSYFKLIQDKDMLERLLSIGSWTMNRRANRMLESVRIAFGLE